VARSATMSARVGILHAIAHALSGNEALRIDEPLVESLLIPQHAAASKCRGIVEARHGCRHAAIRTCVAEADAIRVDRMTAAAACLVGRLAAGGVAGGANGAARRGKHQTKRATGACAPSAAAHLTRRTSERLCFQSGIGLLFDFALSASARCSNRLATRAPLRRYLLRWIPALSDAFGVGDPILRWTARFKRDSKTSQRCKPATVAWPDDPRQDVELHSTRQAQWLKPKRPAPLQSL
jgi:hypothetical protein